MQTCPDSTCCSGSNLTAPSWCFSMTALSRWTHAQNLVATVSLSDHKNTNSSLSKGQLLPRPHQNHPLLSERRVHADLHQRGPRLQNLQTELLVDVGLPRRPARAHGVLPEHASAKMQLKLRRFIPDWIKQAYPAVTRLESNLKKDPCQEDLFEDV